ncbi:ATP-grasp fold amidoligase family protein [Adlercreutzia sp. ZJ141]|uniref:ATP-grasp fold amidoligase family protein n=1 Tax=Adlercreutzia sp. ZJ141 TaxID=2709406 RepID=UPI0013E9DFD0|nr:ATP-grasp fold amidoligase family protein [Adlercreutzia sp. ZJ141]
MKRTLFERVKYRLRKSCYDACHPDYAKKYANRFLPSFSQSDLECCVRHLYEFRMRKKLDLDNVSTFNEKLNWLKCFYHDDRMTECADKVTAPKYFEEQTGLGDSYIVRNIGVFRSASEINFSLLPDEYVLKSNWGSGRQLIVRSGDNVDVEGIREEIASWVDLSTNHYYHGFEYGYKNIEPRIVCEEFIDFEYKLEFFCFNGKPCYFWTVFNDKTDDVCANFFDANTLEQIDLRHGYPNSSKTIDIPAYYGDMFNIAEKLASDFPFVRIDFYKTSDSFKFSEMTFYHWCGLMPFDPESFDLEFGKRIQLPAKML